MKKYTKRFLFALLVAVLVALVAMVASAEVVDSGTCGKSGDNLTWTLDSSGTLTIRGSGAMADYMSNGPTSDKSDYPQWFDDRAQIKEIVIESGVTNIGISAFIACGDCTRIELPEGLTGIGRAAFYECGSLSSITFPESLTYIGSAAFWDAVPLQSISIPKNVTTIEQAAFSAGSLTSISVDPANPNYTTDETGCLCTKDMTTLMLYPGGLTNTSFTIPSYVTKIDDFALSDASNLTSVTVPTSVTKIGDCAFSSWYLKDLFYEGTEAQWNQITLYGEQHYWLESVTIHCSDGIVESPQNPTEPTTDPTTADPTTAPVGATDRCIDPDEGSADKGGTANDQKGSEGNDGKDSFFSNKKTIIMLAAIAAAVIVLAVILALVIKKHRLQKPQFPTVSAVNPQQAPQQSAQPQRPQAPQQMPQQRPQYPQQSTQPQRPQAPQQQRPQTPQQMPQQRPQYPQQGTQPQRPQYPQQGAQPQRPQTPQQMPQPRPQVPQQVPQQPRPQYPQQNNPPYPPQNPQQR